MDDLETLARREARHHDARFADLLLELAVPAMAALLTLGVFLLALG